MTLTLDQIEARLAAGESLDLASQRALVDRIRTLLRQRDEARAALATANRATRRSEESAREFLRRAGCF